VARFRASSRGAAGAREIQRGAGAPSPSIQATALSAIVCPLWSYRSAGSFASACMTDVFDFRREWSPRRSSATVLFVELMASDDHRLRRMAPLNGRWPASISY
jgi:hypothetical protein